MKQRLQILNDPRFRLVYNEKQSFKMGPEPTHLRLNREGFNLVNGLKKKSQVYPGMLLAEHPSIEKGDLHSPIYGEVTSINGRSIFVEARTFEDTSIFPEVEHVDLLAEGLEGDALIERVKKMGVNTRSLAQTKKTLIINALNPSPGVTWAEPMLNVHVRNLQMGIDLHRRLTKADEVILAIPKGSSVVCKGVKIVYVEPEYPNSIDALLICEVTGKENPEGVGVVGLKNIWSLGRIGITGYPLVETVITMGSSKYWGNYIIKNGITVGQLLNFSEMDVKAGDTVLRGGPLRGEAIDDMNRSLTKGSYGLFVAGKGTTPLVEGYSPCVNCGACVHVCPSRIDPSILSRYAEFGKFDECRKEYINQCIDCGLCGYVCIARRPVLQYIRLAIQKLKEEDAAAHLVPIVPVLDKAQEELSA